MIIWSDVFTMINICAYTGLKVSRLGIPLPARPVYPDLNQNSGNITSARAHCRRRKILFPIVSTVVAITGNLPTRFQGRGGIKSESK